MIKKAVLPVAGFGTRFLPASKATPKEMLPIIDKPLVQFAVEEAIDIGIEEIIFITSDDKFSIKKHFERNEKLEKRLVENDKKKSLLSDIQNIILNNLLLFSEGVDKDMLYKSIWKRDQDIHINKLDTHLTNLKKKLKKTIRKILLIN